MLVNDKTWAGVIERALGRKLLGTFLVATSRDAEALLAINQSILPNPKDAFKRAQVFVLFFYSAQLVAERKQSQPPKSSNFHGHVPPDLPFAKRVHASTV